jgi:hypothetical protein
MLQAAAPDRNWSEIAAIGPRLPQSVTSFATGSATPRSSAVCGRSLPLAVTSGGKSYSRPEASPIAASPWKLRAHAFLRLRAR